MSRSRPRPIDLPTEVRLGPRTDPSLLDDARILAAPADPAQWPRWREALRAWRDDARRHKPYDGSHYEVPGREWTRTAYAVALVRLWDEHLYDVGTGRFTPRKLVERGVAEFGGYDAVVLWHAYPALGIDSRNQFDFYRDVPGLAGLVADLHGLGVKVFLDYNPWDTGTRRAGRSDGHELAALVTETGADGIFLDRSRFCILKGGSWFVARGSDWYADGGPQEPEVSFKLVLTGAGLDRSECIGFRCAR